MQWSLSSRPAQEIAIRPLLSFEEFRQAEQLQKMIWGFRDEEVVPAAVFLAARHFGGQVLGALDGECMAGFALAFGAAEEGHAHLHSHMVGVAPQYQNRGLGKQIKLAQREDAIRRGIDRITWTFDPLQIKNGYFNLNKLGGVGVRYLPDLYGTTSSPLHGGMPTDRLVVEWNLKCERVVDSLRGACREPASNAIQVRIPNLASTRTLAGKLESQAALREELMSLLSSGHKVTGLQQSVLGAAYILERDESQWRSNED